MKRIKRSPSMAAAIRTMLLLVPGLCFCTAVQALPQIDGLDLEQMSVRELMRLDAEQALRIARGRTAGASHPGRPERIVRSMKAEPRLSAIYGVGQRLIAEVVVDDVTYLYRNGQALPVGVAPSEEVLLLQKISASCIDLKNAQSAHHLCLRPAQWVGK